MSRALKIAAIAALGAAAAACQSPMDEPMSPTFGRAVASLDAQIIPAAPDPRPPEGSAAVGVGAIRRYEHDAVKAPPSVYTSSVGSQMSNAPASPAPGVTQ